MGNTAAISRRELKGYFATPIGGVLLGASALFFVLVVYATTNEALRFQLAGPVSALTFFHPSRELLSNPVLLVVSFARVLAMYMIPLITMRLFPEEKQARTIEMLLTSPVNETDIVLGKWLAAVLLYLSIIGVGVMEFAISTYGNLDWTIVLTTFATLVSIGAGLLAIGECISTFTKHQLSAATATLLVSGGVLKYCNSGVPHASDLVLCTMLVVLGWFLTLRSIRELRENF